MAPVLLRFSLPLSLLLGVTTVLGFAPFYLFPVPVITLALLFRLWHHRNTPAHIAWLTFFFNMGLFGAGVTWIYISLHDFGAMPMPVAVLSLLVLCIYLSLFPALASWILARLKLITPLLLTMATAALWALSEWLRGMLFTGFPWLATGYSQVPTSPLAGFAPLVGVYGVSFILVLSSGLLSLSLSGGKTSTTRYLPLLLVIWATGFGLQQVQWTQPQGEPVTVSLLQGNISQDIKWQPDHLSDSMHIFARLADQSRSSLIITPEISVPLYRNEVPADYLEQLAGYARRNHGDILIGMVEAPSSKNIYFNTMFSFGTAPEQSYRKYHLVPFGEYIPLKAVFGWVIDVLKIPLSDFSRGGLDQRPMHLAGQRVAINICYEDVFGEEIINQLPEATLLVNVSNDAWFGRSIGPRQHLQISQMRALETGRYMLRATNTGVTAMINEQGIVLQEAEIYTTTSLNVSAQGFSGTTPYVRFGNSIVLGLIGLILLCCLLPGYRSASKNL